MHIYINIYIYIYIYKIYSNINVYLRLSHQNYTKENTETRTCWFDWLIKYIPQLLKKRLVVLKTSFRVLLKL